jgi:hypothetical protein
MGISNRLLQFLPLLFVSIVMAVISNFLAKDKGRNSDLWTILGIIPIVNFFCISYFIGASNLRVEKKIDKLIEALQKNTATK